MKKIMMVVIIMLVAVSGCEFLDDIDALCIIGEERCYDNKRQVCRSGDGELEWQTAKDCSGEELTCYEGSSLCGEESSFPISCCL